MVPHHDSALNELLFEFLESDAEDPSAELEELCRAHPEYAALLRRRVATLLDMGLAGKSTDDDEEHVPERLGEFRIERRLGAGGMGVVYLAHQESLHREVALKLVRPEQLFFEGARERFQREVTTVGRLAHPGIVPVYAVGEDLGIPYFAMEHIRGATLGEILEHLSKQAGVDALSGADFDRALAELGAPESTNDAALFRGTWEEACLRILREAAEALEHAHRSGVLHRDIKPTNVMLTRGGRVMLVDFGLSSDENASERITRSGSQVGSVPYMAPELVDGSQRPSVASDVYALGVTLYELLTLKLPYEGHTLAALSAQLRTASATPPRRHNAKLSWEAETIALTAIDADPERRYSSAGELARDLSNALERRPIFARPPSAALRARRWIERHPALAVGLTAAFLLLVVAPSFFAWQQFGHGKVLAQALSRAETNYATALSAIDRMLVRVSSDHLLDVPHMVEVRRQVLEEAQDLYEGFIADHADDPALERELAMARFELSTVLERLGREADAISALEEAIPAMEACSARNPGDVAPRIHLLNYKKNYAHLLNRTGSSEEAEVAILESLAIADEIEPLADDPAIFAQRKARSLGALVEILARLDRHDESIEVARESVALMAPFADHPHEDVGRVRAKTLQQLSACLDETAPDEAAELLMQAVAAFRSLKGEHPGSSDFAWDLAEALRKHAERLSRAKAQGEALPLMLEAEQIYAKLEEDYPSVQIYKQLLLRVWSYLGIIYSGLGQKAEAAAYHEKAQPLLEEMVESDPENHPLVETLSVNLANTAIGKVSSGEYAESLPLFERSIELRVEMLPKLSPHEAPKVTTGLAVVRSKYAKALAHARLPEECSAQVEHMLELMPESPDALFMGAGAYAILAHELGKEAGPREERQLAELYADRAFTMLDAAIEAGFLHLQFLEADEGFAHLHDHERFEAACSEIADRSQ